jgi:hypothetical protein
MTVRCAICQNFSLKASPHRKLGLYNCKVMKRYEYPNPYIERECAGFAEVPSAQLQARIDWESGTMARPAAKEAKP